MRRYLESFVRQDLLEKMVFIGGPRQVGKTTLSLNILGTEDPDHPAYLNWDDLKTRALLQKGELPAGQALLILDEIHKHRKWKSLVKGLYDRLKKNKRFIVTGSARLDVYRRGGDSLQGRYHYYRLHPFSVKELGLGTSEGVDSLIQYGGFPEPFLKQSERHWRRWQKERRVRVLREDVRDLTEVRDIASLELLVDLLPFRVGAPLSVAALRNDLQVSHEAVSRWIGILEAMYYVYRIPPFGFSKIKAVKKEQKLYFWDWSEVPDRGFRFENLVAGHLLKYCNFREDAEGHKMELRFLRDVEKREIDFVVLKDGRPEFAVECKAGEREVSPWIRYFAARTPIPVFYQVHLGQKIAELKVSKKTVQIIPFLKFALNLPI